MELLRGQRLERQGFAHAFTTRRGGVSQGPYASLNLGMGIGDDADCAENHARLARALDTDMVATVQQVHGVRAEVVDRGTDRVALRDRQADALVTHDGTWVGVRVADCLPLLLADSRTGSAAAVHCGWRGVVAGVVAAACTAMGSRPGDLMATVGPHIRVEAFAIGPDVADQLQAAGGPGAAVESDGLWFGDLCTAVRTQLGSLGVSEDQIEDVGGCTHSEPERFFSYRRDGGKTGRQMAVIAGRA